jgi:hypothetical protein
MLRAEANDHLAGGDLSIWVGPCETLSDPAGQGKGVALRETRKVCRSLRDVNPELLFVSGHGNLLRLEKKSGRRGSSTT